MFTPFYTSVEKYSNSILLRGFDKQGKRIHQRIKYQPHLFYRRGDGGGKYTDIFGTPVERKDFKSISEARKFVETYSEVENMQLYGMNDWPYLYIYENYQDVVPDTDRINTVYLDIEVLADEGFPEPDVAEKEVLSITLRRRNVKVVLGCGEYETQNEREVYLKCDNEYRLLMKFLEVWESMDIDVVTGWYVESFDIQYLVNRIHHILGEEHVKRLSPWGIVRETTKFINGEKSKFYTIFGVSILDYLDLYKKFVLEPRERYTLDYISEYELGVKKLDYSEYGTTPHDLYVASYQKYIEYNIRDVDLVYMLEEKLGLLELTYAIVYDAGVNYVDVLGSVKLWDMIIHRYLREQNIVVPFKKDNIQTNFIEGGYVKDPICGLHKWVVSLDLNSLYPHLIQQYNIGPETKGRVMTGDDYRERLVPFVKNIMFDELLQKRIDTSILKEYGVTVTPNRQFYRREPESFLSVLMKKMYEDRKVYRKKEHEAALENESNPSRENAGLVSRYHNMQWAKKIQLNSAYGACANKYFRWFDLDNAEAITKSGQLSIQWIARKLNEYLNNLLKTDKDYVIAIDTDSVYLNMDDLVQKFFPSKSKEETTDLLDRVCEDKIQELISTSYQELADFVNGHQRMFMKREAISDLGIWTGKKRYMLNVLDNEGVRYTEPKLKMVGIEAIRSSTPTICRERIKDTIALIMKGDEKVVQDFIKKVKEEYKLVSFEDMAFPRSVNFWTARKSVTGSIYKDTYEDPQTIYKKGTPIQVRGSLVYNNLVRKKGLENRVPLIKTGEKIKFCYLMMPNPTQENVIAAPGVLSPELELNKYLDRDMQFQKGYLDPVSNILKHIGWEAEPKASLKTLRRKSY